jgi:hypothetical protein
MDNPASIDDLASGEANRLALGIGPDLDGLEDLA